MSETIIGYRRTFIEALAFVDEIKQYLKLEIKTAECEDLATKIERYAEAQRKSHWIDFREQRPADGQLIHVIQQREDDDGPSYWSGHHYDCPKPWPVDLLWCLWRPFEPPSAEQIAAALARKGGENG